MTLAAASTAGAAFTSAAAAGPQTVAAGSLAAPQAPSAGVVCVPAVSIVVQLSWPAVPNATEYEVQRANAGGGSYAAIGTTTTPAFVDTGASQQRTYNYVVVAKRSAWTSVPSAPVSVATPKLSNCK